MRDSGRFTVIKSGANAEEIKTRFLNDSRISDFVLLKKEFNNFNDILLQKLTEIGKEESFFYNNIDFEKLKNYNKNIKLWTKVLKSQKDKKVIQEKIEEIRDFLAEDKLKVRQKIVYYEKKMKLDNETKTKLEKTITLIDETLKKEPGEASQLVRVIAGLVTLFGFMMLAKLGSDTFLYLDYVKRIANNTLECTYRNGNGIISHEDYEKYRDMLENDRDIFREFADYFKQSRIGNNEDDTYSSVFDLSVLGREPNEETSFYNDDLQMSNYKVFQIDAIQAISLDFEKINLIQPLPVKDRNVILEPVKLVKVI